MADRLRALHAALSWRAFVLIAALALLLSSQILFQEDLFELWSLSDIASAVGQYAFDVFAVGVALFIALTLVEQADVQSTLIRTLLFAVALTLPSVALVWLINWRETGALVPASWQYVLGEAAKFSLFAALAEVVRGLRKRAQRADARAAEIEAAQSELKRQESEVQLLLLQAQIEPHFLFNTLANVRRLYRTQPAAGAAMIDSLMLYLRAALPRVRDDAATLGDELDLVRAYLELFQVRMGPRLWFEIDVAPALRSLAFAPMLLVTLVENSIKHGLAPSESGGTVRVSARHVGNALEVSVTDDGVGFATALKSNATGGTGVGLINIRRQLSARYGAGAHLALEPRSVAGVCARISIPWSSAYSPDNTFPAAAG